MREIELLVPARASFLMPRHATAPPGVAGGAPGAPGRISVIRAGRRRRLAARGVVRLDRGDIVRIETPGGGAHGAPAGVRPAARRG